MILPKVTLTPSGRPQLLASEIERLLLDKVGRWHPLTAAAAAAGLCSI
jgi:hypothetical protein